MSEPSSMSLVARRATPELRAASAAAATEPTSQQYLTFMLGSELFALGILAIREIIEYATPTPVPMMPPHFSGVINLRGTVVPVLDLSIRFGRSGRPPGRRTCIIIIEIAAGEELQQLGLLVDAVNAVVEIASDHIEPPPPFGAGIRTDFIAGMGTVDSRFIVVLNVSNLLGTDELE